jgi:hypothetical protein
MPTKEWKFLSYMRGSAETIFDLVADMPNYGRWLADSSEFRGTVEVTPYPVRLGTTYLDTGRLLKPGAVTEFDRPRHISFHHTVQLRRNFLNMDIDGRIRYSFEAKDGGTVVDRRLLLIFDPRGISHLTLPLLLYGFHKENDRVLAALKLHVETNNTRA